MSKIDYQKLREIAEKTKIAGEAPVMPFDQRINALNDFMKHFSPDIALALLDERERNQQYIKRRDQENEDIALTVGKLRVELEKAKSKLNEQREYYEGVIAGIAELKTKSAPDSFGIIGENIRTQDNRITSDPMFCVYQKREIVVDADYDYDRIVWVDEDGNEANKRQSRRLELLHENFREPPEKWRRVAVKDIDEFVTCCFTEQGCKDYLAANGHNLRLPFIYVKSGFRNAEYIGIRNWLAGIRIKGE
ncbi:TPA: ead/Ea22-like family protein [Escherichia coli]|nr:ead/Ea22-like family protein [Escherichia coli]HAI3444004.1 ead/Ea22-like family protein [Escherichia coli]HBV0382091.1 ead/Ea22-like family protein [Escherichia coli]HCO7555884.1 ead/Ea22-like family protein [Escherichia coli]HCO8345603.1 ead/Ea22-like family protein [Escherichia coli]